MKLVDEVLNGRVQRKGLYQKAINTALLSSGSEAAITVR